MSRYSFTVLWIVNTPRKAKINVDEGEGSLFIYLVPILLKNPTQLEFLINCFHIAMFRLKLLIIKIL